VVSPLLANIVEWHRRNYQSVRYADDMVIIPKAQKRTQRHTDKISQFLAERGMKVSEKKTATTDWFDLWLVSAKRTESLDGSVDNFKAFRQSQTHVNNRIMALPAIVEIQPL